ncbi:hypothetical protein [Streptomyces sp. NPDC005533]|uniref:hypothetical protein n=1 Tax=Streptomyces sp. NPDC005533 TaxID=3364723 RepID=UPI0036BE8F64
MPSLSPCPAAGTMLWPGGSHASLEGFTDCDKLGDLGYIGSEICTGRRKPPGQGQGHKEANQSVNTLRAAVEHAIAHLKDWKIITTRCRGPLTRFLTVAKTVTALAFYKKGW